MQVASAASRLSIGPPSPTLTNPDMILPFNDSSEASSPAKSGPQSLPTPPMGSEERHARSGSNEQRTRLKHSGQSLSPFRNGVLTRTDSQTRGGLNSERGNGRIRYENSKLVYKPSGQEPITSSPTLGDASDEYATSDGPPEQRSLPTGYDYKTPSILDEDENDPESHAAMTRRAEEILANAKLRLNTMEGNLTRARSTLGSRPSSSMSSFADRDAPSIYSIQKERRAHGGFSPLKHRQASPSLKVDHQGHSRVFSETSVPSSLQTTLPKENGAAERNASTDLQRTWFWNGLTRTTSLAERHRNANGLQSLNEDGPAPDSFNSQVIAEEDEESRKGGSNHQSPTTSTFSSQTSSNTTLTKTLSTRDLRDQMTDLKGKISTLKQRAREDSLRRRSLQSLRTPSPLNNAEQDYSKVPIATEQDKGTGLGLLGFPQQDAGAPLVVLDENLVQPSTVPVTGPLLQNGDAQSLRDADSNMVLPSPGKGASAQPPVAQSATQIPPLANDATEDSSRSLSDEEALNGPSPKSVVPPERGEADLSPTASPTAAEPEDSLYDPQEYHEPVGSRHEDRADAFDYEHFFLHSSMGHYGSHGHRKRSSTHSSNYSTETERPPTMVLGDGSSEEERRESPSRHERQNSIDSVSSAATFATAVDAIDEAKGEEGKEEEDEWTPRQTMAGTWLVESPVEPPTVTILNGGRPRKDIDTLSLKTTKRHRREHSVTENGVTPPTPTFPSFAASSPPDVLTYLSALVAKETSPTSATGAPGSELQLSDSDKELVERVVKSLAMVCGDLSSFGKEEKKYEVRVCRRKLDTARRFLDGEVNGEAF